MRYTDVNNESIYVTAVSNSSTTVAGKVKKNPRVWNRRNFCTFCTFVGTNISKHIKTHKGESEVAKVIAMTESNEDNKKEVKAQLEILRNRGNHEHNVQVHQECSGELILSRRNPKEKSFDVKEYGPCPTCFLWIKNKDMKRHTKVRCIAVTKSDPKETPTNPTIQSRILKGEGFCGSKLLQREVYPSMSGDRESLVAQKDELISNLGEEWFNKSQRNKLRHKNYASDHMRRCARMLLLCRELNPAAGETMSDFIKPECFDTVLEAAMMSAGGTGATMAHPSVALKLGYDIQKMAETKQALAIRRYDKDSEEKAKGFLVLKQKEWSSKVAIMAQKIIDERRFTQRLELPQPEDVARVSGHLQSELMTLNLEDKTSWKTYTRAVTLVQARLVTFNKRRPGELESMWCVL